MVEKLFDVLVYQRDSRVDGSVYKSCQCDFACNSNRIEAYEPLARVFWSTAMAPNRKKGLDPTRPAPTIADPYSVSGADSSLSLTEATDLR